MGFFRKLVAVLALSSSAVSARRTQHQIKATVRKWSITSEGSAINVNDFGAVSNCVNLTTVDNTDAFQQALNTAATTGETVMVPEGCFSFNGVINVPEGVTLMGSWQTVPR